MLIGLEELVAAVCIELSDNDPSTNFSGDVASMIPTKRKSLNVGR